MDIPTARRVWSRDVNARVLTKSHITWAQLRGLHFLPCTLQVSPKMSKRLSNTLGDPYSIMGILLGRGSPVFKHVYLDLYVYVHVYTAMRRIHDIRSNYIIYNIYIYSYLEIYESMNI